MAPKILFILTSQESIPGKDKKTGWYLPEFAHPHEALASKAEIVIASPKGGEAPLDPVSIEYFKEDPVCADYLANRSDLWKNTVKLADLAGRAAEFDAVFYPGGHGPMFDLVDDAVSQQLARDLYEQGKIISAVCHGPAALLKVRVKGGADGQEVPLLQGREVTGFDNVGEDAFQATNDMNFSLEDELNRVSGGKYVKAPGEPLDEKVVVDGRIITGQNPASSYGVAHAIAAALKI